MYKSLANAVQIEAAKANTELERAKAKLVEMLGKPELTAVGYMESVAQAQASLNEWTKLYLVATKYQDDAMEQSKALVRRTRALRDQLVEDYGVQSTNAWVTAEARTIRNAKVEVYATLREFIED